MTTDSLANKLNICADKRVIINENFEQFVSGYIEVLIVRKPMLSEIKLNKVSMTKRFQVESGSHSGGYSYGSWLEITNCQSIKSPKQQCS